MDTMDYTKIVGGLCGALLVLLLLNWAGDTIYSVGGGGSSHDEVKNAYVIEVEEAADEVAGDEGPSIEELLASADVAKGEKAFGKCKACHKLTNGDNGVGPHLFGIFGRAVGGVEGFGYSGTLAGLGGTWGVAELDGFITNPKKFAPGTKMSFAGLKKIADRANLIAYLQTVQ